MSSYYEKILATGEVKCINEEIPFDVPNGWEWCKINNIAYVTKLAGFEYTKYIAGNLKTNGIPLFKGKNVQGGKIIYEFEAYIPESLSDELERSQISKKCLLTPYVGTIGNIGLHNKSGKFHLGPNVGKIEILNPVSQVCILEEFVHIYLLSQYGYAELTKHKKATAQESISIEAIRDVLLPIPPTQEQKKIVDKYYQLETFADKYSKLQGCLDKLNTKIFDKFKKSVLQEAIQGKLVPQITEEGTAQELFEQIKAEKQKLVKEGKLKKSSLKDSVIFRGDDNKYWEKNGKNVVCIDKEIPFEIPNNWNWCRLKDIGKTETGTTPSKLHPEYFGNYIPFLSPANIFGSKIISETQGLSNIGVQFGRVVPKNSILQVCIGGSIGKCAIVNKPTTFNQQINSITPYFCNVEFVHIVLQSEYFRLAIIDKATGTATPIINRGNWETLLFPLPPLKEQQRIIEKYKGVTSIMSK